MSVVDLVRLGAWRLRRRYLSLIALLVIGAAMVTVGSALGSYAGQQGTDGLDQGTALRTITLYGDAQPLALETVDRVRAMPGVASAEPVVSVPVGLSETRSALAVVGWNAATAPPMVGGAPAKAPGKGEIILPATADGQDLQGLFRTTAHLTYTVAATDSSGVTKELPLTVVGFSDPTYQVDGPIAAYAAPGTVNRLAAARSGLTPELFAARGYDKVIVTARSTAQVDPVLAAIQKQGVHAVSAVQELDAVPGVIALIRLVTGMLFAALLAVSLLAVVALTQNMCRQRAGDIAILKTYGWSRSRIQLLLTAETTLVCALALAAGLLLGLLVAPWASDQLRNSLDGLALNPPHLPVGQILAGGAVILLALVLGVAVAVGRTARASVGALLRMV
jgi:putative ABC transport system permease protein